MMGFRIQHIEYLFGLAALPLLALLLANLLRWKKKTRARIGDPALVDNLTKSYSPFKFAVKAGLAILAFVGIVLGAANFQRPGAMENINRQGVDVMFVLDVSKSMLARDIKPSRLEKAKQALIRLVDKLENDRVGLVVFAGRAYLQMPLTTDHGAARMYIQDATPDIVPTQGTVIGQALRMANSSFNSKERKYKAIVLVSDGEDHDPEALEEAKKLAANGVMINTIGIGSPEGSPIVDPATNELKKDEQGQTVISRLNEAELQQLADASTGHYIRLDNIDDVVITMVQQLNSIEKKAMSDAEFIDYKSYFQVFLAIALILLLVEYWLPERKSKKRQYAEALQSATRQTASGQTAANQTASGNQASGVSQPRSNSSGTNDKSSKIALGLLLLTLASIPVTSSAQNENALIRSGNRLYKQKLVDSSLHKYEQAVKKAPENPTANYNLGNAQFKKNDYAGAAKSYEASINHSTTDADKEKGYYNRGVAMAKQQKLDESIDAWKNALKLDANDEDARENLQKALMMRQQQQQQQQQQKNKDQQKDQKKDQQKEQKDKKDQQQQQPQQPKPQPSRLNKQQVEQLLKALQQKENEIQDKINQNKVKAPNQPEKDW